MMIDLERVIALACMTNILVLDAWELHQRDAQMLNDFINGC